MKTIRVALVLDKSGSMLHLIHPVVSNYNEKVQQLQLNAKEGDNILVSLVTFNGNVYEHLWDVPADQLQLASIEGFDAGGGTNIYDALGHVVDRWDRETNTADPDNTYLVELLTDGEHGTSDSQCKWPSGILRSKLADLQNKRFTIAVMGQNRHYLQGFAATIGIPISNVSTWATGSAALAHETTKNGTEALGRYLGATRSGLAHTANFYNSVNEVADYAGQAGQREGMDPHTAQLAAWRGGVAPRSGMVTRGLSLTSVNVGAAPASFGGGQMTTNSSMNSTQTSCSVDPSNYTFGTTNVFGAYKKV